MYIRTLDLVLFSGLLYGISTPVGYLIIYIYIYVCVCVCVEKGKNEMHVIV